MPKYPKMEQKISHLREFVLLTWEAVRRNPNYQEDYRRFLENYGLTPDDVKPRKNPDGTEQTPFHPASQGPTGHISPDGRFVMEKEVPDPDKCNRSYMFERWGYACDPDEPRPRGPSWDGYSHILSKDWRKDLKRANQKPDISSSLGLKKLPGVLEVERFPEVFLNHSDPLKVLKDAIVQSGGAVNWDLLPLEVESPSNLTVTINLQAPSQLIRYALEFLVEVCKSELNIPNRKIEVGYKKKCFEIYDLIKEGYTTEGVADLIDLTHYKADEAMKDGLDDYLSDWGVPQVKRCIKDTEKWIDRGSII